ncbi:uncharacterized protein LDX57_001899 [Aspergillus melleus]|uniref:uncharacterized protein n=1 Tax=Aspergillus melleus TaxID=138277 RepID=UPI001E8CADE1|nr:uncharacterized protein LDX57_001899 [Aspergillus melleus]KAH8424145.1 hypothetical protein LDX57_001899 [Aspergillus melleus]
MSSAQDVNPILPLDQPATAETPNEKVLSLDLEENDFLYRMRKNQRIVYVSVLDGDILPPDSYGRTDSYQILSKLQNIPEWNEAWTTLTVRRNPHGVIESTPDEFHPHGLDLKSLDVTSTSVPFYDFTDLTVTSRISDRLSRVNLNYGDGESLILKIARFAHEFPYVQREISIFEIIFF